MKININLNKQYEKMKQIKESLEQSVSADKKAFERFPDLAKEDKNNFFVRQLASQERDLEMMTKAIVCNHRFEHVGFENNDKIEVQTCVNCGITIKIQASLGWLPGDRL